MIKVRRFLNLTFYIIQYMINRIFLVTVLISTAISFNLAAQHAKRTAPYDSLENYLEGDLKLYIGQELYLKPKPRKLKKTGYQGFYLDYEAKKKDKETNIYKCCQVGTSVSRYDSLQGKLFEVMKVVTGKGMNLKMRDYKLDPERTYYLKLRRTDTNEEFYYEYDGYEHNWLFVMNGYWQKSRQLLVGKDYVLRGFIDVKNYNTHKPVEFVNGETWKCIDFALDVNKLDMVMIYENEKGDVIAQQKNPHYTLVWDKASATLYENEMGKYWDTVMKLETEIGMSERMVEMSLGKPHKIYNAVHGVQWVYDHVVLIFKEGVVAGYE